MRATITREELAEQQALQQRLAQNGGKTHGAGALLPDSEERKRYNMAEQAYAQQLRESLEKKGA